MMTINEKLFLAAVARELIIRLRFCEDSEFADFIVRCVVSSDIKSLAPDNMRTK